MSSNSQHNLAMYHTTSLKLRQTPLQAITLHDPFLSV